MINIGTHKIVSETKPKSKSNIVTESDLKHVSDLLADFRIYTNVPDFDTKTELYRWRDEQIRMKLNK